MISKLPLLFIGQTLNVRRTNMNTNDLSIEQLENDFWGEPSLDSYVVITCHKARKKPICDLSYEEIRLLIGQKIGLKYLLPIALDILKKEPLIEVTFYEGDLMNELLRLEISEWKDSELLHRFKSLIESCFDILNNSEDIDNDRLRVYL